jgi:hypothetical protein
MDAADAARRSVTVPPDRDAALADELRRAQRRVAGLQVEPGAKQRAFQRLLAISDAAKHDTTRAAARLDRFLQDLDDAPVDGAGEPEAPA